MNCFNRMTIQMYLDGELPDEQMAGVQLHLETCEKCRQLFEDRQEGISVVHAFLSELQKGDGASDAPPFDPGTERIRFRKRNILPLASRIAAGIALLIGLFWITKGKPGSQDITPDQADLMLQELMGDMEPNKAWHNGQMGIIILDEQGDVIQSFVSSDIE